MPNNSNPQALWPIVLFLIIFIGTGLALTLAGQAMAFYQLSATVAIIPAIIMAVLQGGGNYTKKINIFLSGMGEINIITMCVIYLLAGGFAQVAQSIGGVTATVNFGLSLLPPAFILPGLFIIGAFVATAMGSGMGTVAAIAPIAVGIGAQTTISLPLLLGVVMGGAMFGDNLSMISDTTIAATRTQGCQMRDKFRMNLLIATPAALLTLVLLWIAGSSGTVIHNEPYEFIKVLPYITILIMAVMGVNVFLVLMTGIVFTGMVGLFTIEGYTLLTWVQDMYKGFAGMNEIMVLSMLIGGLGELMRFQGGINWLLAKVDTLSTRMAKNNPQKAGEWGIAALVFFADLCTANNTVAIILTGHVSKEIATKNNIDPRRSASLLDIFSCVGQGLIPYGAQLLLAGSIAKLSPVTLAMNNWYCILLGIAGALSIAFNWPKIRK